MKYLALLLLSLPAFAQVESFQIGEELHHELSVCVSKDSAISILDKDLKSGKEAATTLWKKTDDCDVLPVSGPQVGKVVYSVKLKRDSGEITAQVVEIIADGKVVAYFLTSKPVLAKLEVKPSNKS